jgi:hypothetical protein
LIQKQSSVWVNTYQAELAKDPDSSSTESSRNNVIALWHTIRQIYGKAVARDVANLVCTNPSHQKTIELTALWDQRTVRDE